MAMAESSYCFDAKIEGYAQKVQEKLQQRTISHPGEKFQG